MRLVNNVTKNWIQMDGSTIKVRRVNALLTSRFITNGQIPSDECVSYAERFALFQNFDEKDRKMAQTILINSFYTAHDLQGNVYNMKYNIDRLNALIDEIFAILKKGKKRNG